MIVPEEIALLRERGVTSFAPQDGQRLGLPGMINQLIRACDTDLTAEGPGIDALLTGDPAALARAITVLAMTKAGARLQVHPASVTSAASRLEAAGLVVRRPDPADGRGVLVEITDAGRAVADEATALLNDQVFSRPELTAPGLRAMVDTLRDLRPEAGDFDQ